MLGDLFYSLGTLAGTGLGVIEERLTPSDIEHRGGSSDPATARSTAEPADSWASTRADSGDGRDPRDTDLLVDSVLSATAGWMVGKALRPRPVSWPRVVVAGIGATVLADAVDRALGLPTHRARAYDEDPDALLVRFGAGLAIAAGYAALLYPRLPGSPLTKGALFGLMEIAAAPHGGLVRVATDTPGLRFPLKDLAVPIDEDAGPLTHLAFGISLGILYRPDFDEGA